MGSSGTLYVVATPIGNLEDVTLRALETLRRVDLVACEDTRRTRKLLDRYDIEARCLSCHKFNEARSAGKILAELRQGRDVALVSDSGTPAISDPGHRLVAAAVEEGLLVRPIPGPNAAIGALSASGLPSDEFTFRGFLPHRGGQRRRALAALALERPTQLFHESPTRIVESLGDMADILGTRRCCVVREMTKKFEQWYHGLLPGVARSIASQKPRGEYCIIVEGAGRPSGQNAGSVSTDGRGGNESGVSSSELSKSYSSLLSGGLDRRAAIKQLARRTGLSRSEVYRRLVEERTDSPDVRRPVPGRRSGR